MLELRNIQANVYRNGNNVGGIKINPNGGNTCDLNVLKFLTREEKKELDQLTQKLIDFLQICATAKQEYLVKKDPITQNYKVIKKLGDEEAQVGMIRRDNKQLYFMSILNEGEVQECLEQINHRHLTDFYYGGCHYDGD